jgi:hypothetical protein
MHFHIDDVCYFRVQRKTQVNKRLIESNDQTHTDTPSKFWRTDTTNSYNNYSLDGATMQSEVYGEAMQADMPTWLGDDLTATKTLCESGLNTFLGDEDRLHKAFISNFIKIDDDKNFIIKLGEDVMIFLISLIEARSFRMRTLALVTYLKARGSKVDTTFFVGIAAMYVGKIFVESTSTAPEQMQADFDVLSALETARNSLDSYTKLKELPIFKKLFKFTVYMLSYGVFEKLGCDAAMKSVCKVTDEIVKKDYSSTPDLIHCIMDTLLTVCTLGVQCVKAGSFSPVMHTEGVYGEWYEESLRLQRLSNHISSLDAHGTTYFEYVGQLKEGITKGENMIKFKALEKLDKRFIMTQVNMLKSIDANLITKTAATARRKAPLAILIHGDTSIGKSQFQDICYYHYCGVRKLPKDSHYRYNRVPGTQYWDGFASNMHTCVIDDAGQMNPNLGLDASVGEFIQVVNNVAFVPNQAALEDKGRTPFKCELVTATTNTIHLNAKEYFSFPIAMARRFLTISLIIKPKYADTRGMLDRTKLENDPGKYMDIWNISILSVCDDGSHCAKFNVVYQFETIKDFLLWFTTFIHEHHVSQDAAMKASAIGEMEQCEHCHLPRGMCSCYSEDEIGNAVRQQMHMQARMEYPDEELDTDTCWTIPDSVNVYGEQPLPGFLSSFQSDDPIFRDFAYRARDGTIKVINDPPPFRVCKMLTLAQMVFHYKTIAPPGNKLWFMHPKGCATHKNDVWAKVDKDKKLPRAGPTVNLFHSRDEVMSGEAMQAERSDERGVPASMIDKFRQSMAKMCVKCENEQNHFCFYEQCDVVFPGVAPYDAYMADKALIASCPLWLRMRIYMFHLMTRWWYTSWFYSFFLYMFLGPNWRLKFAMRMFTTQEGGSLFLKCVGHRIQHKLGYTSCMWRIIAAATCLSATVGIVTLISRMVLGSDVSRKSKKSLTDEYTDIIQGAILSRAKPPDDKYTEKTKPFYHREPPALTGFELTPTSKCATATSTISFKDLIAGNVAFVDANSKPQRAGVGCKSNMLHICGQLWVTNKHSFPDGAFYLNVKLSPSDVGPNKDDIYITPSQCYTLPDSDVMFIRILDMPPRKNIMQYFTQSLIDVRWDGEHIWRNAEGVWDTFRARNIARLDSPLINKDGFGRPVLHVDPVWGCQVDKTWAGMCGAPLCIQNYAGAAILGIHAVGSPTFSGNLSVTREMIRLAIESLHIPNISSGTIPISAPSAQRALGPMHPKCPAMFTQTGTVDAFGTFEGFRTKPKSKVTDTTICEAMQSRGYENKWVAPPMDYRPFYTAFQEMVNPSVMFDKDRLMSCKDQFSKHLWKELDAEAKEELHPFDMFTAINGKPGLLYCDPINKSTSAGAPYKHSKRLHLSPIESPPGCSFFDVDDEIKDRIMSMKETYARGEQFHPQFCIHLKDQALTEAKALKGKTRLFSSLEMAASLLVRQLMLCVPMSVQNNRFVWCSAPGTIAQSLEWEEILERISIHGTERMIAGDYGFFDKRVPGSVMILAFEVVHYMLSNSGNYNEDEMQQLTGLMFDICFPMTDFDGHMFQFWGTNPSGHPLTVIINGIINVLYMLYCWNTLAPEWARDSFFELVAMMSYGDDNIMGVAESAPWFTHTEIQRVLAEVGIPYTMADKDAPSVPYISIDQCSFLKRTWVWNDEVGAMLAPLEEQSIIKSLMICTASKTCSPQARDVAAISSAVREYFFYGREVFEEKVTMLKQIVEECDLTVYLEDSTFPTWKQLVDQFWDNSKHVKLRNRVATRPTV